MVKKIKHHWLPGRAQGQVLPLPTVELIGAPDDRGVLNVGGRLGAGHGPHAIRQQLSQMMIGMHGAIGRIQLHQGMDVELGEAIEAGHAAMRKAVAADLKSGVIPIVLGGGHDYGYPHVAGASDAFHSKVALINVDAHLDVRPPIAEGITSGSPFYLALEDGVIKGRNFVEFGIQEHCNDEAFLGYAQAHGVKVLTLDEVRAGAGPVALMNKLISGFARRGYKTVVSFDVDAVQMAHAPGVSAPQSDGFTPGEFLAMAELCGSSPHVATIGFFELAPPLDERQQTTRLVATAIHRYLSAISRRDGKLPRPGLFPRRVFRRRS